jgi:Uri superfamily endonuclease
MLPSIPSETGSYALHLTLAAPQSLQVGRLGEFEFPSGEYIYLGSALGSGGLQARLGRHIRGDGSSHWHIDWLRANSLVAGYYFLVTNQRLECLWSEALMNSPQATVPVPRFGASDCRDPENPCLAHLVHLNHGRHSESIQEILSRKSGSEVSYYEFTSDSQSELGYIG